MKKTCGFHLLLLLVLLTTFTPWLAVTHVQYESSAQVTPTIYLQPTQNVFFTNQTFVGDRFNVTVWVRDAPQISGWQVYMKFDDTMINATRWIEPATDPQYIFYGKTTHTDPTPPDPNYVHLGAGSARVQAGSYLLPTPPAQPPSGGSGKLCIFEFVITRYPTSDTVYSLLHIDSENTFLLDPDGNEISSVIKQDGSFEYVFVTVPPLRLVENPQFIQFTPYQNMVGGSFNTTVCVDGPTSATALTNVSFTLSFDSSLFSTSESDVVLNSIWTGPHSVSVDTGQIAVEVSNPSSLPSEPTVVICMITFTVQGQQTVPPQTLGDHVDVGINFTSSTVLNSAGNVIDQITPYNQTIRIYAYQTQAAVLGITPPAIIGMGTTIQNDTSFTVNVSVTKIYNPSLVQVELLYNQSVIICTGITLIGEVTSDELASHIFQTGLAIASVLISGHQNPILAGPIFQFVFKAVTENTASYLNFSQPYGQDTFIQDSSGAIVNATYLEATVHVSETPRAQLVVEGSQNHLDALVKEQCSFEITVKNEGSVEASNISLSLSGVPSQWLQFSGDEFSLIPNSNETLLVTVAPTYTGEFNLTIVAMSAEGDSATARVTLSVTESTANPPWELIIPAMIIGIGAVTVFLIVRSRRRKKT